MLLRFYDIVSGIKTEKTAGGRKAQDSEDEETMNDEIDGWVHIKEYKEA